MGRGYLHKPTPSHPFLYLSDHGASIIDELGQHHCNIVIDGGRMISPFSWIPYKAAKGKHCSTANLQEKHGSPRFQPLSMPFLLYSSLSLVRVGAPKMMQNPHGQYIGKSFQIKVICSQ